ncbi:hypothetical protein H6F89_00080 [Cyanobacteria bacterium FACHB-63]|nr:hypothetical protein [Cyanobacteria bacterium FACHB-63]
MATKHSLISYYGTSNQSALKALIQEYGDHLQILTASEKFGMLLQLCDWQYSDTISQEEDGDEILLQHHIEESLSIPNHGDAWSAIELLAQHGISSDECLDLMNALIQQLKEGVYLQ